MKIKELYIHNIASIEDAHINFENEPLGKSDVFLIAGKTGSGKSTILDSISLALFDSTPRMANSQMNGKILDGGEELKVKDCKQLLRRNTVEGYVELKFKGNNSKDYTSKWRVYRSYKKLTGSIKTDWVLTIENTNETLTRKKDIEEEINSAVGLDFMQFCRTTMLAQGEFSKFLNSSDSDKAQILEKITGMDIYARIGAKVFELYNRRKKDYELAQERIKGVEILSEERKDELTKEIEQLDSDYSNLKKQTDSITEKINWLKKEEEIRIKIENLQKQEGTISKKMEEEEFLRALETVNSWDITSEIRPIFKDSEDKEEKLKESRTAEKRERERFSKLIKGINYIVGQREEGEEKIKILQKNLIVFDKIRSIIENNETLIAYLKNLEEALSDIEKEKTKIKLSLKKLDDLKPKEEEVVKKLEEVNRELEKKKSDVILKEAEIEKINLPGKRAKLTEVDREISNLKINRERVLNYLKQRETLTNKEKFLREKEKELEDTKKKLNDLSPLIKVALTEKEKALEIYESQKETIDKFAQTLRAKLKKGDICPVCRQEILSEFDSESSIKELIAGFEARVKETQKIYDNLQIDFHKAEAEEKSVIQLIDQTKNEVSHLKEEINILYSAIKKESNGIVLDEDSHDVLVLIDSKMEERNLVVRQLSSEISKGEEIDKIIKALLKDRDKIQGEIENKNNDLENLRREMNSVETEIKTSTGIINNKELSVKNIKISIKTLGGEYFTEYRLEQPVVTIKEIKKVKENHQKITDEKAEIEKQIKEYKDLIEDITNLKNDILAVKPEWRTESDEEKVEVRNIKSFATILLREVSSLETIITNLKTGIEEDTEELNKFFIQNQSFTLEKLKEIVTLPKEDIDNLRKFTDGTKQRMQEIKSILISEKESLKGHLESAPKVKSSSEPVDVLIEKNESYHKQLKEIGENRGKLLEVLSRDEELQATLGRLMQEIDEKKKEQDKWYKLNELIGDSQGTKFRRIAQCYVLDNLIYGANIYLNTLSGRYRLKHEPGNFIITVEDAYQGYVTRSAATLSGGETFLVSLALALSMSDIGESLGVDTLFIDEGFGTLSGDHLQKAINTLRSLHSKTGKQVGIISHVEELQEKIPVQIRLEQSGESSSSKIKIYPE